MSYACSGANRVAWFSNPNAYYNGYRPASPTRLTRRTRRQCPLDEQHRGYRCGIPRRRKHGARGSGRPDGTDIPSSLAASANAYNSVTVSGPTTRVTKSDLS